MSDKSNTTPDQIERIAREAFPTTFAMTTTSNGAASCHLTENVISAILRLCGQVIFPKEEANAKTN